ncbi:guided entry of tail-anchored proteins factor 1-like isoform X1 [Mytilus trossulus]|uniref:guided entry of tail-anchored proteins factor 1-like isoform X1 n=1 Tax=Mytilus trossulus TaxID=6551 RepID=UPI0030069C62
MFLLILVLILVIFFNILSNFTQIISKQLSKQIYPVCDSELNIRSQIKDLKTEQNGVQMADEFARHAKIQRRIDKLLTQVKQQTSDRNNKCTMVGFAVQIGIYVLHALVMISLMISYRQEPLLQFQPEWFYPLQKIVAFPTGVSGGLGIGCWVLICNSVIYRIKMFIE